MVLSSLSSGTLLVIYLQSSNFLKSNIFNLHNKIKTETSFSSLHASIVQQPFNTCTVLSLALN